MQEKNLDYSAGKRVVLRADGISKRYGSVVALNNVSFEIYENEIVGLIGDNGAGKSTLMKIISGNFPPNEGKIYIEGQEVNFASPSDARIAGVETVYQDLLLCNNLDAVANLFVGRELRKWFLVFDFLKKSKMTKIAHETLDEVGINIPSLQERVEYLSGGQRQAIALGRFVRWGHKLILLDEPTAALGVRETMIVLDLIKLIKEKRKVSMILISHNLQQIFQLVDRIIVLRHGEIVGIRERRSTNPDEIVSLITGAAFIDSKVK